MNTTVESHTKTEYLYVKDLPDVGGLRARRMEALRREAGCAKGNGWDRLFVWWSGGVLSFAAVMKPILGGTIQPTMVQPPDAIEVYDLTRDLVPQFAEARAIHW